jgi:putative flippase GtrA
VAGGLLCAALDVGIMQLLLRAGAGAAAATTAGYLASLLLNYAFHSKVTFDAAASAAGFKRYLCVVGINYLLTLGCVSAGAHLLGMPLAGKLVSLPMVAVNGYLLSKHWIFRKAAT